MTKEKDIKSISKLLFELSTDPEKKDAVTEKNLELILRFEALSRSLSEAFSKMDSEYAEAFEMLVKESDSRVKGYLADLSKKVDKETSSIKSSLEKTMDMNISSEKELKLEIVKAKSSIKDISETYTSSLESAKTVFFKEIDSHVNKSSEDFKKIREEIKSGFKEIESIKNDVVNKFSTLSSQHGGGNMNRKISINGTIISTRYTDINFKGSGVTYSAVNNDVTRQVDLTLTSSGGGSGFQQPTSGALGQSTFVWATAPSVIVADQGRPMQKTSTDGTVNWTGTTTTVLTISPTFDIFSTN